MREEYAKIRDNPRAFLRRLKVQGVGPNGEPRLMELAELWPEQVPWLEALLTCRLVFGIKPRQVGYSTITIAYFFWKVMTSAHPRLVLQMVHELGALKRFAKMLRIFHDNQPPELQVRVKPNSTEETIYGHTGGGFNRLLAGGAGQGRAWTYTDIHATEMSKWRTGTSAAPTDEGQAADEEVWQSALNTVHDSGGQIVVESTGNGPRGLHFGLYEQVKIDPNWRLVFVPWNQVRRYRLALNDAEAKALDLDLDRRERKLQEEFGLDLEQLAWRRYRIRTLKGSELLFRREYPLTDLEPFMSTESGWFNQDVLVRMLRFARNTSAPLAHLQIFEDYQEGHRYVLSLDTSGGTGNDECSLHVIRDDLCQVATWNHDKAAPLEQAQMVGRLSNLYRRPLTIIESNWFGRIVLDNLPPGIRLWKDSDAEDFYTTPQTKRELFVHAREVMDNELCVVQDAETVRHAQKIVEKSNGRIEGSGVSRDDRIFSWALGLWAARRFWRRDDDGLRREKSRVRGILSQFGGPGVQR